MIPFKYKTCKQCHQYKIIILFRYRSDDNCYSNTCIDCLNQNARNNPKIKERKRIYKQNPVYKQKASEYYKSYASTEKFKNHRAARRKILRKNKQSSPEEKLKKNISSSVLKFLKSKNLSKNNKSIWKFLPYSPEELKQHLESLFEPWMNWNNHGVYNLKTWNDEDPTTWTWNLDHIIPHSTFNYTSMDCDKFKDCWDLKNLRPLKAKENVIDGAKKSRH